MWMVTLSCFTQILRSWKFVLKVPVTVSGTLVSKMWSNQPPPSFHGIVKHELMDLLSMYCILDIVLSVSQHKVLALASG